MKSGEKAKNPVPWRYNGEIYVFFRLLRVRFNKKVVRFVESIACVNENKQFVVAYRRGESK